MKFLQLWLLIGLAILLHGCSSAKFLEEDEQLLSSVKLTSDTKLPTSLPLKGQIRQEPNSKWFSLSKVRLGMYCMAGKGNSGVAKLLRRLGEAPVVYDHQLTVKSQNALRLALRDHGYRHAQVEVDTTHRRHKVNVHYQLKCGAPNYIRAITYVADDSCMNEVLQGIKKASVLREGKPLVIDQLSRERSRVVESLRDLGYYKINKDFVSFLVDTCYDELAVEVSLLLKIPAGVDSTFAYVPHRLRTIDVYEGITQKEEACDSSHYKGLDFYHNDKRLRILRRVYNSLIAVRPDSLYSDENVSHTYSALNALPAVSHCFVVTEVSDSTPEIDHHIQVFRAKPYGISFEIEGTNTAGDFGTAALLTFKHRNLFRGAELFELKLRGAYEAITGLEGYADENYMEYSVEGKLTMPNFTLPGLEKLRYTHQTSSELNALYNAQERPEFHRKLLSAGFSYNWKKNKQDNWQHRWDVLSLNYMFMPWISHTFRQHYLEGDDPRYGILRYSYENLFIMKMGYNFVYNSHRVSTNTTFLTNAWQLKGGVETAGNFLNLTRNVFGAEREPDGTYKIFDIAYSQYAKFDLDYVRSFVLTDNSSIAMHAAVGVAIPYGNSKILPYEKRYFSGGANSVRGWSVRELGPGSYVGKDGKIDFINQTGNLKLDLSVEYRTHLFWKFYGAIFADAGNIWNTRSYVDQPGGTFHWDTFYRQIAVAYGFGLRINVDYCIIRLDGGMKAINPAVTHGKLHYPILAPKFTRDFTFHFAVGLPF